MTYPVEYMEALGEAIAIELAEGKSLRAICSADGMPDRATIQRWMKDSPEFAAKCACARDQYGDVVVESLVDIEDMVLSDQIKADVARVVISSRQWRAAKLAPKKYGDKLHTEVTGANGGPVQTTSVLDMTGLTTEHVRALASIPILAR